MTYTQRFTTALIGAALILTSLAPFNSVAALGAASMTLTGGTNATGHFSVTVYENTGSDTVTGANVVLDFSGPVSGVAYDYSVGPFVATTPSGAHNAYGAVTGSQPVARVTFTVATPGMVTASVGTASYLKHVDGTDVAKFDINGGSAQFIYAVASTPTPVQSTPTPAKSTPTPTKSGVTTTTPVKTTSTPTPSANTTPTPTVTSTPTSDVMGAQASNSATPTPTVTPTTVVKNAHSNTPWIIAVMAILIAAAAAAYYFVFRNKVASKKS